jgi:hypothetical protein
VACGPPVFFAEKIIPSPERRNGQIFRNLGKAGAAAL